MEAVPIERQKTGGRCRRSLILAFSFLAFWRPSLAAWVPVDCEDRITEVRRLHTELGTADIEAAWQNHMVAVRRSRPGSPLYVPHPFPATDAEIVANFKHAYLEMHFGGTPWEKLLASVYLALKESLHRVEIVQVENWTFSRCTSPTPYFNLLRFFDWSGREVVRSTQDFTGHTGIYHNLRRPAPPLPPLGEVDALLKSRFGRTLHAEQAQYVTVGGLPYCSASTPCIAFKSVGNLYLIDRGQLLYEVAPSAPRKSVIAFRDEQAALGPAGLRRLGPEFEAPMITLGFEWAKARLVGGQKP